MVMSKRAHMIRAGHIPDPNAIPPVVKLDYTFSELTMVADRTDDELLKYAALTVRRNLFPIRSRIYEWINSKFALIFRKY